MNAIYNLPLYGKLILIALILFLLRLFYNGADSVEQQQHAIHRTSDYSVTDFTLTVMDKNGRPSRIIKGAEMTHYPGDDSTEITQPVAQFIQLAQDDWLLTADHGHTQGKGDNILLTGHVVVANKDHPDIKLLTHKLTLDTVYNTAYTDEAVTLKSPYGETHSVGLHATLEDRTINLHSKVKGHYDAPPSN